jgi:hypothetical protein
MAGEENVAFGGDGTKRGIAAVLFLSGCFVSLDAMSTLNSSPWTHRTFGSDPAKKKTAQQYVVLAMGVSFGLSGVSSFIARSPWPLYGTALSNVLLWYVYAQAGNKASEGGASTR